MKRSLATRSLLGGLTFLAACGPRITGAFTNSFYLVGILFLAAVYLLNPADVAPRLERVFLVIISLGLSVAAADVVMRRALISRLYYRPNEMFLQHWPPCPLLLRYRSNARYQGPASGDLAAISGRGDLKETRTVEFETDRFGFRNRRDSFQKTLDVIVLGDSMGAGNGTTQDKTWAVLLEKHYGLAMYNLSLPGSPWEEYMDLAIELKHLKVHEGTTVIWAIFDGNDITGRYGDVFEPAGLPWNNFLSRMLVRLQTFRNRSSIQLLLYQLFFHTRLHSLLSPQATGEEPAPPGAAQVMVKDFINGNKILFYRLYYLEARLSRSQILGLDNYTKLRQTFAAMKDLASRNGLRVQVVLLPCKEEVYAWVLEGASPWDSSTSASDFSLVLGSLCRDTGFSYVDLKGELILESERLYRESGSLLFWYDGTHLNETGNEVVASLVHRELAAGLPPPRAVGADVHGGRRQP